MRRCRYEVLPLKSLGEQLHAIPRDTNVTVTCSPKKGIPATLQTAAQLRALGLRVIPHIAARQVENRAHLEEIVHTLDELGIDDIFVPGGDIPEPRGIYASCLELLRDLRELDRGPSRIGVTAYPEGHPLIPADVLAQALHDKIPYADYMVTQLCFSASTTARWLRALRDAGNPLELFIGIPGQIDKRKLLTISLRIGVGDSIRFLRKQRGISALIGLGTYRPDSLVAEHAEAVAWDDRVAGLHIYTFNQVDSTSSWRQEVLADEVEPALAEGKQL